MQRWIAGILIGLSIGLLVGITMDQGFSEAVWGFLGVLVGAAVTIFVEQLRTERERQKRIGEWKLAALTKLGNATDELDRAAGVVFTIRLEDLNRNDRFRTVYQLRPEAHALGQAIRRHNLADGAYLGKGLHSAATAFREATAALAAFVPEWIDDIDAALDQDAKERLRDELKTISGKRVKLGDQLFGLLDEAIAEALHP